VFQGARKIWDFDWISFRAVIFVFVPKKMFFIVLDTLEDALRGSSGEKGVYMEPFIGVLCQNGFT